MKITISHAETARFDGLQVKSFKVNGHKSCLRNSCSVGVFGCVSLYQPIRMRQLEVCQNNKVMDKSCTDKGEHDAMQAYIYFGSQPL